MTVDVEQEEYVVGIQFVDGTHITPICYGCPPEVTVGTLRIRRGSGDYEDFPLVHIREFRTLKR